MAWRGFWSLALCGMLTVAGCSGGGGGGSPPPTLGVSCLNGETAPTRAQCDMTRCPDGTMVETRASLAATATACGAAVCPDGATIAPTSDDASCPMVSCDDGNAVFRGRDCAMTACPNGEMVPTQLTNTATLAQCDMTRCPDGRMVLEQTTRTATLAQCDMHQCPNGEMVLEQSTNTATLAQCDMTTCPNGTSAPIGRAGTPLSECPMTTCPNGSSAPIGRAGTPLSECPMSVCPDGRTRVPTGNESSCPMTTCPDGTTRVPTGNESSCPMTTCPDGEIVPTLGTQAATLGQCDMHRCPDGRMVLEQSTSEATIAQCDMHQCPNGEMVLEQSTNEATLAQCDMTECPNGNMVFTQSTSEATLAQCDMTACPNGEMVLTQLTETATRNQCDMTTCPNGTSAPIGMVATPLSECPMTTCPDGSSAPIGMAGTLLSECPTRACPDGNRVFTGTDCAMTRCPDNTMVETRATIAATAAACDAAVCPDGATIAPTSDDASCPTMECPDGNDVFEGTDCAMTRCPDNTVVETRATIAATATACNAVACPDGATIAADRESCPTMECPDGNDVFEGTDCAMTQCPNNTMVETRATIAETATACGARVCPDGATIAPIGDDSSCPTMTCVDRSTVLEGTQCAVTECPDGTQVPTQATLDETANLCGGGAVACPDGVSIEANRASCPMMECPDGTRILVGLECATTKLCPDDNTVPAADACDMRRCPDGTMVETQATLAATAAVCGGGAVACPDGVSVAASLDSCPMNPCPDGSLVSRVAGEGPLSGCPVITCPDGSMAPRGLSGAPESQCPMIRCDGRNFAPRGMAATPMSECLITCPDNSRAKIGPEGSPLANCERVLCPDGITMQPAGTEEETCPMTRCPDDSLIQTQRTLALTAAACPVETDICPNEGSLTHRGTTTGCPTYACDDGSREVISNVDTCPMTSCPNGSRVQTKTTLAATATACGAVACSDGVSIEADRASCPSQMTCPDGATSVAAGSPQLCPMTTCPGGMMVPTQGTPIATAALCPAAATACPDGSLVATGETDTETAAACTPETDNDLLVCFDGETIVPTGQLQDCPRTLCPNGTTPTFTGLEDTTCPTSTCSDGTTIVFAGLESTCPTTMTCPDGTSQRQAGRRDFCPSIRCPNGESAPVGPAAAPLSQCPIATCPDGITGTLVGNEASTCGTTTCSDGLTEVVRGNESQCPTTLCPDGTTRVAAGPIDLTNTLCPTVACAGQGNRRVLVGEEAQCNLVFCADGITQVARGAEASCPSTTATRDRPLYLRPCAAEPTDPELRMQCPLTLLNIGDAYARDLTGAGVTIAVLDSGLESDHPEFQDADRTFDVDNQPTFQLEADGETYTFTVADFPGIEDVELFAHGTAIAGIIAANRDGIPRAFNMHGVAYGSDIIFRGISGRYNRPPGQTMPEAFNLPNKITAAYAAQVFGGWARDPNINLAMTAQIFALTSIEDDDPTTFETPLWPLARVDPTLGVIARAMMERSAPDADPTLFVFPAGNHGQSEIVFSLNFPYYYPELRSHVAIVTSIDEDGHISAFANRCGISATWCIAAPGTRLAAPTQFANNIDAQSWISADGSGYGFVNGTSFAAPVVVGALALMLEALGDQLGTEEILRRMYASANKTRQYSQEAEIEAQYIEGGTEGDTTMVQNPNAGGVIYGQGLLDIGAAVIPVGRSTLRSTLGNTRTSVHEAPRFEIGESRIALGPAFGDALRRALGGRDAVFFDALNTSFPFPATDFATTNETLNENSLRLPHERFREEGIKGDVFEQRGKRHALAMSLGRDRPFHTGMSEFNLSPRRRDYAELARDGYSLGVRMDIAHAHHISASIFTGRTRDTQNLAQDAPDDTYGAHISYGKRIAAFRFGVEAGYIRESEQILGAYSQGVFAYDGETPTFFAGILGMYEFGRDWQAQVHARIGRTKPDALGIAQTGLHDITPLSSSAFSAGIYRRNVFTQDDGLGFIVAQPLRVENGRAALTYATGRTRAGQILEETLDIDLTPSGRALDLELVYHWGDTFALTGGTTLNARHERGKTDAYIAARLSRKF